MNHPQALRAIVKQKAMGKTVIGCFPLYPPVEIFAAMGLLPIVLWHLKDDLSDLAESDKHVQHYACGIARELAQFVLSDTGDCLDGIFSYNACDTLRNFPEILAQATADACHPIPMLRMHVPQVNRSYTDPDHYLKNEITALIGDIESAYDCSFSPAAFRRTTGLYAQMRKLCREAERLVAKGALSFSAFCNVVLSGYFIPVEEQIKTLADLIAQAAVPADFEGAAVMVSGIIPPPLSVLQAMDAAGLRVVANDIASLRRSYAYSPGETNDPAQYYAEFFADHFPCSTLLYKTDSREQAFLNLVETSGARGVIFSGEKFCEYEYFEFPYLEARLKEIGIPFLRLEFGVDDTQNTAAHETRIEAFSEMLG